MPASATSSLSGAIPRPMPPSTNPIPTATPSPPISSPASLGSPILKSVSPPIPRPIPRLPAQRPISTISGARSMPGRAGRSANFFRFRGLSPLPRSGPRLRHREPDRPWNFAHRQFCSGRPLQRRLRCLGAGLARRPVRGFGRRPGDAQDRRRNRGCRSVPSATKGRDLRVPFLYVEPGRSGLRDLPHPRPPPNSGGDGVGPAR